MGARKKSCVIRGFTYMEAVIIILVITIMAAYIVPNLAALERERTQKGLEAAILRLPAEARDEAVRTQTPVAISVQGNELVLQEMPPQNIQTINSTQQIATGAPQILKQIDLGSDISITSVQTDGQSGDVGTWQWNVYPDGTADDGGIQFQEGTATKSLVLDPDSEARWVDGPLPDQIATPWPAGQLEQRAQ